MVTSHQRLGGDFLVLVLVPMGEIADAEIQWLNSCGESEFVNCHLKGRYTCCRPGRAHIAWSRDVELDDFIRNLDVVAMVGEAGPISDVFLVIFMTGRRMDGVVHDRYQVSISIGCKGDLLETRGPPSQVEHLAAAHLDLDRSSEIKARHHSQKELVLRPQSLPESTSYETVLHR